MLPSKFGQEIKNTNKQVISQTLAFISSAFVLVAALAWNDAIKALLNKYFKAGSGIISLFIYATIVTIIAAVVTRRLGKIAEKYKTDDETV